jgi:hypothetical protein
LQLRGSHMDSLPYVYTDHHVHTPQQHPSRRPGHPISCFLQHPRRETTRRVHRSRASSSPTAHQHHHWQCFPRTSTSRSAPAPSCMGSLASYTLQQREVRPVKLGGGFGRSAHPPTGSGAYPRRTVCVYGATGCTAGSSRAFGGNTPVLCSTVVDGGSGSQAHSSHVGGPPSYSVWWTPTTPTLASSPSVQPTFHRAPSAVRGAWKLAVREPPMNVCQYV